MLHIVVVHIDRNECVIFSNLCFDSLDQFLKTYVDRLCRRKARSQLEAKLIIALILVKPIHGVASPGFFNFVTTRNAVWLPMIGQFAAKFEQDGVNDFCVLQQLFV